jgi:hypothetical protein
VTMHPNPETPEQSQNIADPAHTDDVRQKLQTLESQFHEWSGKVDGAAAQMEKDVRQVSQLLQHTARKAYEVGQMHAEISEIQDSVSNAMTHLGGVEGLDHLQQEHQNLLRTLETFQASSRQFREMQSEASRVETRIEDRLSLAQQRVEEINQILAVAKAELVRQAMSLSDQVRQGNVSNPSESLELDQAQADIAAIRQELRERHSTLNQMHAEISEAIATFQSLQQQQPIPATSVDMSSDDDNTMLVPDDTEIEVGPGLEPMRSPDQSLPIPPPGGGAPSANVPLRSLDSGVNRDLEQMRSEVYGIVQQLRADKDALQKEQKQRLRALEQKLKGTRNLLATGTVIALILAIVAIALKFISI